MGEEIISASFVSGAKFKLVQEHPYREHVPAYDRIGGNMEYRSPVKGYEGLYQTLSRLSKIASWLLWNLVENRNSITNIAVMKAKTPLESKNISLAYKELEKFNLVRRIQRQQYLINPMAFIPKPGYYEEVLTQWKALKVNQIPEEASE